MSRCLAPRLVCAVAAIVLTTHGVRGDGCRTGSLGDGQVGAIVDGRTLRLDDGREVRLAGVEVADAGAPAALRSLVLGQAVMLHGADDAPDRYGRQAAFVYRRNADTSVQAELTGQGMLLASGNAVEACSKALAAAEATARAGPHGAWSTRSVIKSAESSGEILNSAGQFAVVEGRIVSAREAGNTLYLNFGRRWTRDFAVLIPKRAFAGFAAAGLTAATLANRQVRVRGWVDIRGGPRIEATEPGQIELIDRGWRSERKQ